MQMRRRSGSAAVLAAAIMLVAVPSLYAQHPVRVDSGGGPAGDSALAVYLKSLRFIRDHVSSDERPLNWKQTNEMARVEPAAMLASDTGSVGRGRIAVRIVNLGADTVRRFGLLPWGTTYIWFENDRGSRFAVYISADSTGRILARTRVKMLSEFLADSTPYVRVPMARFGTNPTPSLAAVTICWSNCDRGPWCRPDSVRSMTWVGPLKSGRD